VEICRNVGLTEAIQNRSYKKLLKSNTFVFYPPKRQIKDEIGSGKLAFPDLRFLIDNVWQNGTTSNAAMVSIVAMMAMCQFPSQPSFCTEFLFILEAVPVHCYDLSARPARTLFGLVVIVVTVYAK
jgi:hypothetical protein